MVKAPHMMAITLCIMAKAPHTMAKSPHTMAKAPYKITNAPHEMKCYHLRQLWLSIQLTKFTTFYFFINRLLDRLRLQQFHRVVAIPFCVVVTGTLQFPALEVV